LVTAKCGQAALPDSIPRRAELIQSRREAIIRDFPPRAKHSSLKERLHENFQFPMTWHQSAVDVQILRALNFG